MIKASVRRLFDFSNKISPFVLSFHMWSILWVNSTASDNMKLTWQLREMWPNVFQHSNKNITFSATRKTHFHSKWRNISKNWSTAWRVSPTGGVTLIWKYLHINTNFSYFIYPECCFFCSSNNNDNIDIYVH